MARLLPLAGLVLLGSCSPPPADATAAEPLAGERWASALLSAPTRKPCRAAGCRIVARSTLLAAGDSTYAESLVGRDSVLRRWRVRVGEPVRVWVERGGPRRVAGISERERHARVRLAFRRWETVGIPVRFAFTRDSSLAEVRVRWVDTLPGPRAGFIRWTSNPNGWLTGAEVALARRNAEGEAYPLSVIDAIVTHEVGHLLGLEHSPDSTDVMAAQVQSRVPTVRDRSTVRFLYSQPPGRVR